MDRQGKRKGDFKGKKDHLARWKDSDNYSRWFTANLHLRSAVKSHAPLNRHLRRSHQWRMGCRRACRRSEELDRAPRKILIAVLCVSAVKPLLISVL